MLAEGPGVHRTTPRVRRTTPRVHWTTPGVRRTTLRVRRTSPGVGRTTPGGLLCGPSKSFHAHVSLNFCGADRGCGPADSLKSSDAYYVRQLLSPFQDYATHAMNVDNTIPLMLIKSVAGRPGPASNIALLQPCSHGQAMQPRRSEIKKAMGTEYSAEYGSD